MSLILTQIQAPPGRVSLSGITPDALNGLDSSAVARLPLTCGAQTYTLGDFFRVEGQGDASLLIRGPDRRFTDIGGGMAAGDLRVDGDAGDHLGRNMRGGSLIVDGHAGAFAGSLLAGGTIRIRGNAGSHVGAPPPWLGAGMSGGAIVIEGNAGDRCGDRLRRGEIFVHGSVGAFCASRMVAGTITVGAGAGAHLGHAMHRGTILLLDGSPVLAPTFVESVDAAHAYFGLLWRSWQRRFADDRVLGGFAARALGSRPVTRRWLGDLAADGRGEIFSMQA